MKYLIANWKSNKKTVEVEQWFKKMAKLYQEDGKHNFDNLEIVVCPPFVYLPIAKKFRDSYRLPIKLGAQDVSPFDKGPYTGEVTASMLSEFATYLIIGHSERREYFLEGNDLLTKKVEQANRANLCSIFCIQDEKTFIPKGTSLVAYEPVWAIGTGTSDTPDRANQIAFKVKRRKKVSIFLYGGSVTPDNIKSFVATRYIDGVLVGGASLEGDKFWEMIVNVSGI